MPSYKVSGGVEGAASTLLEHVQRQTKRKEEQEDELRTWHQKVQSVVLGREDVNPDYITALLSGKDVASIKPIQAGYVSKADLAADRGERREARYTRQEFLNRPEVKEFMTIKRQSDTMRTVMEEFQQGDTRNQVALDQSLITLFNKLTDPTSVVRESEYARTAMNLPFFNALRGKVEKFQRGGAGLTDNDRQALIQVAQIIANGAGEMYNQTLSDYTNIGQNEFPRTDINSITRGMQPYQAQSYQGGQRLPSFQTEEEAEAAGIPSGSIVLIGGRRARKR